MNIKKPYHTPLKSNDRAFYCKYIAYIQMVNSFQDLIYNNRKLIALQLSM